MPYLTALQRQRALRDEALSAESPVIDLDPARGPRTIRIRPVGLTYAYVRYSAAFAKRATSADRSTTIERRPLPFPDDGHPADARIGLTPEQAIAMGVEECPYSARGHVAQRRWAMNVLEILGADLFDVRVVDGPRSLFETFWNLERANQERNLQTGRKRYVEDVGGAVSHFFDIVVAPPKPKRPNAMPFHAEIGELTEIWEREIAALAAVGRPSDEELARLRSTVAEPRSMVVPPDWAFYGHPLRRMFAPRV